MMSAVGVIGAVIVLEARPVYGYLASRALGTNAPAISDLVFGFGAAALVCILATVVPIMVALKRLEAVER